MKLIDLLVQELPKRGGWPAAYNVISTNGYGQVWCYSINASGKTSGIELYIHSSEEGHVTREQYKAALAAAQQPVWSGEGLPPVGCECEYTKQTLPGDEWTQCTVDYVGASFVVYRDCYGVELTGIIGDIKFRPIRSEADKKRDDAIDKLTDAICGEIPDTGMATAAKYAARVYNAVAAGEVKGLKLE